MSFGGRWRELIKKYGKVAIGVHFSVSAASIAGLYVAIKNNVDVESIFRRVGVGLSSGAPDKDSAPSTAAASGDAAVFLDGYDSPAAAGQQHEQQQQQPKANNKTAETVASSGGALALAVICNKALFPVRVPITVALTPPVARFLARRNLLKTQV